MFRQNKLLARVSWNEPFGKFSKIRASLRKPTWCLLFLVPVLILMKLIHMLAGPQLITTLNPLSFSVKQNRIKRRYDNFEVWQMDCFIALLTELGHKIDWQKRINSHSLLFCSIFIQVPLQVTLVIAHLRVISTIVILRCLFLGVSKHVFDLYPEQKKLRLHLNCTDE